jgi:endonuclease-3 related protein
MSGPDRLMQIYDMLFKSFGPQHWWPGDSPFEIIVGAVLTQNTNWSNVEKAINNIKEAKCLSPEALYTMNDADLADLIRPAGYFRLKAGRLKHLLQWLFDNFNGQLHHVEPLSTEILRPSLLSVKGIGPETADSILLYAFERPVFVVDMYTARITTRHELISPPFDYHDLQDLFQGNLVNDVALFNEYHALLVRLGKEYCKPKPKCADCPLNPLPHVVEGMD